MRAVIIIGFGILFLALMVLCLTEIASKADEKADAEFRQCRLVKEF